MGIAENRLFFLVDDEGRKFCSGRRFRSAADHPADHTTPIGEHLALTFPDGSVAEGDAAAFAEGLIIDFYGRPVRAHVVPGPWTEALSAFVGRTHPTGQMRPAGRRDRRLSPDPGVERLRRRACRARRPLPASSTPLGSG